MTKKKFNIKSFFSLFICLILVICLTGCNKKKKEDDNNKDKPIVVSVEKIEVFCDKTTLLVGDETNISTTVYPENATDKNYIINYSVDNIVSVENGKLNALSEGEVDITFISNSNSNISKTITIKVNPYIYPEDISIKYDRSDLFIGNEITFSYQIVPENTTSPITSVTSDHPEIAKVLDNKIIALSEGMATITFTVSNTQEISKSIIINVLPDLATEVYDVKYIASGPGEDTSREVTINYHAYNKDTFIEYTVATDSSFSNATKFVGEFYYFCETKDTLETPFLERYVCRNFIKNLTPNTEYIYRINKGNDTYSDIYSFKTSSGNGGMSFLFLADIHYWAKDDGTSHGSEVSEKTIAKALEINPNINLVVDAGDTVDTGGDEDCWKVMYENRNSLKHLLYAPVAGNHEYYIMNTGQWDNRFFKVFTPTNFNGHSGKIGSTYYFVYNDVLFLMLDNAKKTGYNYFYPWLEEVLKTTKAKYVIADMHIPINCGANSANGTDSDPKLMAIFEKYGVDLVLAGHYHNENYSTSFKDGAGNDDASVVYLRGSYAGVKSAGSDVEGSIRGYIIDVTENGHFTITVINGRGENIRTYEFDTKKYSQSTPCDENTIIESFTPSYNAEGKTVHFSWTPLAYGNLESINIKETLRNEISTEVLLISKGYFETTLPADKVGYDYSFEVDFLFKDGTIITKTYKISTQIDSNLTVNEVTSNSASVTITPASKEYNYMIEFYDIYLNGELYKRINYSIENLNYTLSNLESNKEYKLEYYAIGYYGEIIFTKEYSLKTE